MDVLRAWLAFNRCADFDAAAVAVLLARGVDPVGLVTEPRAEIERLGLDPTAVPSRLDIAWAGVDADLAWLARATTHHALGFAMPAYPARLREIAAAPPVLFVEGDPGLLGQPQIAIVGSRQPTHYGEGHAFEMARALGAHGFVVTSGLARGIDAAAHRGAIDAGGATIAVMATGSDRIYPHAHRGLARRIAECGALVSEFALGTPPLQHHFPRRNRLISGLALGVLVVEAKLPSGSLTTAHHAMEQGREVFAIPGAISNPLARGCHALLREGAALVECVDDVLAQIAPQLRSAASGRARPSTPNRDPGSAAVLRAIGHELVDFDTIVARSGLTAQKVSSILSALEIQGEIAAQPGARYGIPVRLG